MNHNRPTMAALGRFFLALIAVCALASSLSAAPMVYTGLVVTDVRVGTTLIHNASLKITFEAIPTISSQSRFPAKSAAELHFLFLLKASLISRLNSGGIPAGRDSRTAKSSLLLTNVMAGSGSDHFSAPMVWSRHIQWLLLWEPLNILQSRMALP